MRFEMGDLNACLQEVCSFWLHRFHQQGVALYFLANEKLKPFPFDNFKVQHIVSNLLDNASKFTPSGGTVWLNAEPHVWERRTEKSVRVAGDRRKPSLTAVPNSVRISVSDTGDGMDTETLEHIFEPFFTTKEIGKGTGLGLAIVMGVVKQHEGFIDVHSEPGKGTAFHIHIPVSEVAAEPPPEPDTALVRGGHETILVGEDDDGLRDLADEILQGFGYRVLLARDGEEAFRTFMAHRSEISLVLLDVIMPKLNGADAYERMSREKPGLPVIFTSGYSERGAMLNSMPIHGAPMLQKPYGAKLLARKVRQTLDAALPDPIPT